MPSHTFPIAALALVCLLVLAGCSGGMGGGGGNAGAGDVSGGSAESSGGGGGGATGDGGLAAGGAQMRNTQALQTQQALIKTGHVRLEVKNFGVASGNLTRATRRAGGYVSASGETTRTVDGGNVTTGSLTLRVPSWNFSRLLSRVKANRHGPRLADQHD